MLDKVDRNSFGKNILKGEYYSNSKHVAVELKSNKLRATENAIVIRGKIFFWLNPFVD